LSPWRQKTGGGGLRVDDQAKRVGADVTTLGENRRFFGPRGGMANSSTKGVTKGRNQSVREAICIKKDKEERRGGRGRRRGAGKVKEGRKTDEKED